MPTRSTPLANVPFMKGETEQTQSESAEWQTLWSSTSPSVVLKGRSWLGRLAYVRILWQDPRQIRLQLSLSLKDQGPPWFWQWHIHFFACAFTCLFMNCLLYSSSISIISEVTVVKLSGRGFTGNKWVCVSVCFNSSISVRSRSIHVQY